MKSLPSAPEGQPPLLTCPPEIIDKISKFLFESSEDGNGRTSLLALRSTCQDMYNKSLHAFATRYACEWKGVFGKNTITSSVEVFKSKELASHVKKITIGHVSYEMVEHIYKAEAVLEPFQSRRERRRAREARASSKIEGEDLRRYEYDLVSSYISGTHTEAMAELLTLLPALESVCIDDSPKILEYRPETWEKLLFPFGRNLTTYSMKGWNCRTCYRLGRKSEAKQCMHLHELTMAFDALLKAKKQPTTLALTLKDLQSSHIDAFLHFPATEFQVYHIVLSDLRKLTVDIARRGYQKDWRGPSQTELWRNEELSIKLEPYFDVDIFTRIILATTKLEHLNISYNFSHMPIECVSGLFTRLQLPALKTIHLHDMTVDKTDLAGFLRRHARCLEEVIFEKLILTDPALRPHPVHTHDGILVPGNVVLKSTVEDKGWMVILNELQSMLRLKKIFVFALVQAEASPYTPGRRPGTGEIILFDVDEDTREYLSIVDLLSRAGTTDDNSNGIGRKVTGLGEVKQALNAMLKDMWVATKNWLHI